MRKTIKQLLLLPQFQQFITASATGRRLMPSGRKLRTGTIEQYQLIYYLLEDFEKTKQKIVRIRLINSTAIRIIQKEKNYWERFFRAFSSFLYKDRDCYDQYVGSVFKGIKTFFHYLIVEKALPVGEFHKKFRIPAESFVPVVLSPSQLRFLILDKAFEKMLSPSLQKTKDIFVFGCTVALRYSDLMQLKKTDIQYTAEGVNAVLHTQKTGAEVRIPLPDYAIAIINKYKRKAGRHVLPRSANSNFNLQIKLLIKKAGWNHTLSKIRHKQGRPVEIKNKLGEIWRFYDHITAHTMRRTAITTLLLLGVDEASVRRISGHAPGSKEFYRYVIIVQDFLNARVKQAHIKLLEENESWLR